MLKSCFTLRRVVAAGCQHHRSVCSGSLRSVRSGFLGPSTWTCSAPKAPQLSFLQSRWPRPRTPTGVSRRSTHHHPANCGHPDPWSVVSLSAPLRHHGSPCSLNSQERFQSPTVATDNAVCTEHTPSVLPKTVVKCHVGLIRVNQGRSVRTNTRLIEGDSNTQISLEISAASVYSRWIT